MKVELKSQPLLYNLKKKHPHSWKETSKPPGGYDDFSQVFSHRIRSCLPPLDPIKWTQN